METAVDLLIARLDADDGDPDLEASAAEDDFAPYIPWHMPAAPGCQIADPPEIGYIEWQTRGSHKVNADGQEIAASGPVPDELSIDSTHVKAHRLAAGSKRGSGRKRLVARAAAGPAKSTAWPMIAADRSPSH